MSNFTSSKPKKPKAAEPPPSAVTAHAHSSETNEHYTPSWLTDLARQVLDGIDLDPMSSERANETVKAGFIMTESDEVLPPGSELAPMRFVGRQWLEPWHSRSWCIGSHNPNPEMREPTRVWLNPAGGKLNPKTLEPLPRNENGRQGGPGISQAGMAWCKLADQYMLGNVRCALFLCFSINVMRTAQDPRLREFFPRTVNPSQFPFVIFRDRIPFDTINATGDRVPGKSPPQDSAMVLIPEGWQELAHSPKRYAVRDTMDRCGVLTVERFADLLSPHGDIRI